MVKIQMVATAGAEIYLKPIKLAQAKFAIFSLSVATAAMPEE